MEIPKNLFQKIQSPYAVSNYGAAESKMVVLKRPLALTGLT